MSRYGTCSFCGNNFVPIWFTEEETKIISGSLHKTGRKRKACSHLECQDCGNKECVDDTFDSPWY